MKKSPRLQEEEPQVVTRSSEFRYIPCDSINIGFNLAGAKFIFGVNEVDGSVFELMGVHMSIEDATAFRDLLIEGISHVEKSREADN